MRYGLLSDAHGNPLGVALCLQALAASGAQEIRFLGDAVGYMPGAAAVLEQLRRVGAFCQKGNHEAMLLGELPVRPGVRDAYQLDECRARLHPDDLAWMSSWPESTTIERDGRTVLLVHGSPADRLAEYVYPDSPIEGFGRLGYDAIFTANTHRPFVRWDGGTLVVNIGSCGLPRDQGDLAACALYDTDDNSCQILRVPMPRADVLAQFPDASLHRLVPECLARVTDSPVGRVYHAARA